MLFKFGKVTSLPCSLCKLHNETIMHLFYDCLIVKELCNQLKSILSNDLSNMYTTECYIQILGVDTNEHFILNHFLLIFEMYIYNARTTRYLNISHLLIYIKGIRDTEEKLCENNAKRRKEFNKKWENVLIN